MSGRVDKEPVRNVLVIGGSYFAGRVFVEELARQGDTKITVYNRGRCPLGMAEVSELTGDRRDPDRIRAVIPPLHWDAVVDFCAYDPADIEILLQNLPGRIGQYVFISTTTVYDKTLDLPIREDAPKLAAPQIELGSQAAYGFDKWRAEQAVEAQCQSMGVNHTIFRPAIIYGYYNYAPRETYFFDLLRKHQPVVVPDSGLALFSFIWVVDMALMLIRSLGEKNTYGQAFNLAADELVSYPRIIEVLQQITGKTIDTVAMPVAEIERQGIPAPFPLAEHLIYSGEAARRTFGVTFTPFASGLRQALKYYLAAQRHARS
jgi:nucleoside-diphosphate-sugar epimerase